jgi:hypothetical protein
MLLSGCEIQLECPMSRRPLTAFFLAAAVTCSGSTLATPACEPVVYGLKLDSVTVDGTVSTGLPEFGGRIAFEGGQTYYGHVFDPDSRMERVVGVHP